MNRFLLPALGIFLAVVQPVGAASRPCWVYFTDRGGIDIGKAVSAKATSRAEPKTRSRRARAMGAAAITDVTDLPVNPGHVAGVADITGNIRTVSRYFNAVTTELDERDEVRVRELPYVRDIEPVAVLTGHPMPRDGSIAPSAARTTALDYGQSYTQLEMVGVPKLHTRGYMGEGVFVAILDSGFSGLSHAAFDSVSISHRWDFVEHDDDIGDDDHGSDILSILAALDPGAMIGAAPYATYALARTEIVEQEIRAEEDYFVAGVEWADSLGADIITTSLGYNTFDDFSYTYADMDGMTGKTTIAADIAVNHGVVVVTSAGNEGNNSWHFITTPADGFNVIAVGSVGADRVVSSFSSRGPTYDGRVKPDFMALGENVVVAHAGTPDSYRRAEGTSVAAPAVSGAIALLLEVNPYWTPDVLADSLRFYSTPAGADTLYGYGFIDAFSTAGLPDEGTEVTAFRVYDPYPQPAVLGNVGDRVYFPMDVPARAKDLRFRIFTFDGTMVAKLDGTLARTGSLRERGDAPSWDGTNITGDAVAPGIYYYTVELAGYGVHRGKIAVLR